MKLIVGFAVPLLAGLVFQQFYNMMDTIIVGKYLGVKQLAGVGATGALNFLVLGFCTGTCCGFSIPVAQSFGAGDEHMLRKYVANAIWLSVIFAVAVTLTVCLLCRKILGWMDTPEDIFEYSYSYIFVIFLGIPAIILYNLVSGIIRSLGDSKTPVYFLVIAACLNIAFDLIAILGFHTGVEGAAGATVLAQLISGLLCVFYMRKNYPILRFEKDELHFDRKCAGVLCNMGMPMGLQYSVTAIGSVTLQTAVNGLGSGAVAAVTAAGRINSLCCCPLDALGSTMATYSGQNVGARKLGRVKEGLHSAAFLGTCYALLALGVMYFFGRNLLLLFLDTSDLQVFNNARQMQMTNAAFLILLTLIYLFRFSIQGMGYSKLAVIAGVFELFARVFVAMVLVPAFGFTGVCFANPIAWLMADVFLIPAFGYAFRKIGRQIGMPEEPEKQKQTVRFRAFRLHPGRG